MLLTSVTSLLLIDLDLPTNSHSSLQKLISLKIRLFATDFHITSLLRDTVIFFVCYLQCMLYCTNPASGCHTLINSIVLYLRHN